VNPETLLQAIQQVLDLGASVTFENFGFPEDHTCRFVVAKNGFNVSVSVSMSLLRDAATPEVLLAERLAIATAQLVRRVERP
jgi:hypothetical protein